MPQHVDRAQAKAEASACSSVSPSTQYLSCLVPKSIGYFDPETSKHIGYADPLGLLYLASVVAKGILVLCSCLYAEKE